MSVRCQATKSSASTIAMKTSVELTCIFLIIVSVIHSSLSHFTSTPKDRSLLTENASIGDCQSCKIVIESVISSLKRAAKGDGSRDSTWEEEKSKWLHKRHEIPFSDITSHVCKDEPIYIANCLQMYTKAEEQIRDFWEREHHESDDFYVEVCVNKLQVCCPKLHFGKDCAACPGDHNNVCSGSGKCRGDGTRKGNGTCACNAGYVGEVCDKCAQDYYQTYNAEGKMICVPCHRCCLGGCHGTSQKDCVACKPGFIFDADEGCLDKNECDDPGICTREQFCLNSIGSYMCAQCDKSCNSCYGDGPDMCRKCATGYSKKGELCIADREDEDPSDKLTATRYMTYVGLLIATGILLPKSTTLGSVVGAMVLSYILGAEYYCMINGHTGLVDLKEFDLSQMFRT